MDVSQEAFIKAYRALPKFRGDSAFYTWLYRIAINTAKNHLVAKGRRPPDMDVDVDDAHQLESGRGLRDIENPENNLYRDELSQVVRKTLDKLLKISVRLCRYVSLRGLVMKISRILWIVRWAPYVPEYSGHVKQSIKKLLRLYNKD